MSKVIIFSATALTLLLGACSNLSSTKGPTNAKDSSVMQNNNAAQTFNLDTAKLKMDESFYQCPMNTEVISDKPGSCPKCGMELSKMKKQ